MVCAPSTSDSAPRSRASAHRALAGIRMPSPDVMWLNMTARVRGVMASAKPLTMPSGPPSASVDSGSSFTTMPYRLAATLNDEMPPVCS